MIFLELNKETLDSEIKEEMQKTELVIYDFKTDLKNKMDDIINQNKQKISKIKDI